MLVARDGTIASVEVAPHPGVQGWNALDMNRKGGAVCALQGPPVSLSDFSLRVFARFNSLVYEALRAGPMASCSSLPLFSLMSCRLVETKTPELSLAMLL